MGGSQASESAVDTLEPSLLQSETNNLLATLLPRAADFKKGDSVEVWSASKGAWLAGRVEEVYETDGFDETYKVPAGVVKVSSVAGVKYIRPEQIGIDLRKATTSP